MSLHVCPFVETNCGTESTVIFSTTGSTMSSSLKFSPGDMCLFVVRAQCGIPSFLPSGDVSNLEIYTIDYDDSDVQTEDYNYTSSGFFGSST